ncbi:unnamed protein product [Bemisia tabaci]|uniref:Deoxyuridine 5'-triphosphate nucleotidohydrolase n=1 Tax=Bemisia tabaci TaxID=7038 RepID=A0A9P0AIB2_BEMTA|nr:unnamed protein product [Bemisia tabaci]
MSSRTVAVRISCENYDLTNFEDSNGFDLPANISFPILLKARGSVIVDTGIKLNLPPFLYADVRPRSGLAFSHEVVAFSGLIDHGYTGNIFVKLFNLGDRDYTIYPGDRIAQLVFCESIKPRFFPIRKEIQTSRNARGFGSTSSPLNNDEVVFLPFIFNKNSAVEEEITPDK